MKTIIFSLLICALLAFASANEQTISIELSQESNSNWIAIFVQNAIVDTSSVQIKDSATDSWVELEQTDDGWTFSPSSDVQFPLSVRLTSVNGDKITATNALRSLEDTVDTGKQYSSPSIETRSNRHKDNDHDGNGKKHSNNDNGNSNTKHTSSPTAAPSKHSSTAAPSKHTSSPTTKKASTTAKAPSTTTTKAGSTTKPSSTTTKAPSSTTTKAPSSSSSSSTGCSGSIKLLVPLYAYPGSDWDTVAAGGSSVDTVAIINPDSGPGTGPDSNYDTYMAKMVSAGVEMVGYVHTSYGARAIADVKSDIDVYATEFPDLVGIFLDECSADASEVSYYSELYTYIMSFPGWKYDILNPGAVPTSGYTAVSTQIVTYEDTSSGFTDSENPSFATCADKNAFAMITYAASSTSNMESAISAAKSKGYYGWVYATDGTASGNTYGTVPSYYSTMVSYIADTIN